MNELFRLYTAEHCLQGERRFIVINLIKEMFLYQVIYGYKSKF